MGRRAFIIGAVVALAAPRTTAGQQANKVYRVGVLSPGSPPPGPLEAFREGLRDLGYVEGKTLALEWRFGEGKNERLAALAGELVRLKVDVIFAVNTPAAQAAKKATTTIPIVIARLADPVKTGLVSSIAHPGGNITGLSSITEEVAAKRLELLKAAVPGVSRVAALWNAGNPGHQHVVEGMEVASPQLGLQFLSLPIVSEGPSIPPRGVGAPGRGASEHHYAGRSVTTARILGVVLRQGSCIRPRPCGAWSRNVSVYRRADGPRVTCRTYGPRNRSPACEGPQRADTAVRRGVST